jgi:hypothetical protein
MRNIQEALTHAIPLEHATVPPRGLDSGGRPTHDGRARNIRGPHGPGSDRARQVLLARSPSGSPCYYARRGNKDSEPGDIIADELSQGQVIMTVRASDE